MTHKPLLLLTALLANFIYASHALADQGQINGTTLSKQREIFQAAEEALTSDDLDRFRRLKTTLKDYPLYPYLVYQETIHDLKHQTPNQIRKRLTYLQDTPLKKQLRDRWLSLLAEEKLWYTYMEFSTPGGSIERQCQRLTAMMRTGKRQQALQAAETIWLSARPRPKACPRPDSSSDP